MALGSALVGAVLGGAYVSRQQGDDAGGTRSTPPAVATSAEALYAELQPVALANCTLERFGEAADGGYLLCANLLGRVSAGYSYGISGYDGWGCEVSSRLDMPVHQYDCFDLSVPACPTGRTIFHGECVAGVPSRDDEGRRFDTVSGHVLVNGDADGQLVLKMDVEGAEWDSFFRMNEATLNLIDQLVVEFHGIHEDRFLATIRRLKQYFEIAHLHYNNHTCDVAAAPHPAHVYEVLFVSKRLARLAPSEPAPVRPHALDAPNDPFSPDCQS